MAIHGIGKNNRGRIKQLKFTSKQTLLGIQIGSERCYSRKIGGGYSEVLIEVQEIRKA
jgi:hypothetical protein